MTVETMWAEYIKNCGEWGMGTIGRSCFVPVF